MGVRKDGNTFCDGCKKTLINKHKFLLEKMFGYLTRTSAGAERLYYCQSCYINKVNLIYPDSNPTQNPLCMEQCYYCKSSLGETYVYGFGELDKNSVLVWAAFTCEGCWQEIGGEIFLK